MTSMAVSAALLCCRICCSRQRTICSPHRDTFSHACSILYNPTSGRINHSHGHTQSQYLVFPPWEVSVACLKSDRASKNSFMVSRGLRKPSRTSWEDSVTSFDAMYTQRRLSRLLAVQLPVSHLLGLGGRGLLTAQKFSNLKVGST